MKFNQLRRLLLTILVITAALVLTFAFSACDTDDRESDVVPHEHEAGEWEITVEPTCTAEGARVQKCTICEAEMTAETIAATGHIAGSWTVTKEATCTIVGEQVQKCSSCNEVVTTEELPMTEHISGEWKTIVAASCTSEGSRKKACAVCSKELATEIVPMHPNTVNQSEVPATCLNTGLTRGSYCPDCNTVFVEQTVIPIADHAWVIDAAITATCESEGLTQGSHCSVCNLIQLAQERIPKRDHSPIDVPAESATCTSSGKTAGVKCSMCKQFIVEQNIIPMLGHDIDYYTGECSRCLQSDHVKYTSYDTMVSEYGTVDSYIIDLRFMIASSGTYNISIKSNHRYVRVIGDESTTYTNVIFTIESRTRDIDIDFINVNLENQNTLISSSSSCNINIGMYGAKCTFVCSAGGDGYITNDLGLTDGEDGNIAWSLGKGLLNILCSADNVKIKGGNGGKGGSSAVDVRDGGDGAHAIYSGSITVKFASGFSTSNISIEAGKGGDGGYRWALVGIYGEDGYTPEATNTPIMYK